MATSNPPAGATQRQARSEPSSSESRPTNLRSLSRDLFRPLELVGHSVKTPIFSVAEFAAAAARFAAPPELEPGDAELLAAAGPLDLSDTVHLMPPIGVADRPITAIVTTTAGGTTALSAACAAASSSALMPPPASAFGAPSVGEAPEELGEAHPLRSARPSEQPQGEKKRKANIPRNYTPDESLANMMPEERDELAERAARGGAAAQGLLQPGRSVLLRVAIYDGRRRESVWTVHGDQTLLELRQKLVCSGTQRLQAQAQEAGLPQLNGSSMVWMEGVFYIDVRQLQPQTV